MNKPKYRLRQFVVLTIAVFSVLAASADTWYVDAARPVDTGDGTSWVTAKKLLESGVGLANTNGGSVLVANGTYSPVAEVTVTNGVTVSSVNGAGSTFVNGSGARRCFYLNHTNAVVEGFSLTNGLAGFGGGARIGKGMLRNCWLIRNTASDANVSGGGAHVAGSGIIEGCLISNNAASSSGGYGGGLYLGEGGQALNCTNVNNRSPIGAGAYLYNGAVVSGGVVRANITNGIGFGYQANKPASLVIDCQISGNTGFTTGARDGGGLWIYGTDGTTLVTRCTIDNNVAKSGGGMYLNSPYVYVNSCSIMSNTSSAGGGVWIGLNVTNALFTNCLVAGNIETNTLISGNPGGAGFHVEGAAGQVVEIVDCIIRGNSAGTTPGGGLWMDASAKLLSVRSCQIVSNWAVVSGGGMYQRAGSVSNCTFTGNSLGSGNTSGGGIALTGGGVYNCLFTGNSAGNFGAGMLVSGGTVDCCSVIGNVAVNNAGGINVVNASCWIGNTIIVSNSAASATTKDFRFQSNGQSSLWYSCYTYADVAPPAGRGNMTQDPVFRDYAGGNFRLTNRSPCVNAGTNELWMNGAQDLDGLPRIRQATVDMGAYEWLPSATIFAFR